MDTELEMWILEETGRFVRGDLGNRHSRLDGSTMFEEPLVGFVAGDDPIFDRYREVIGEFHLTPVEVAAKISSERGLPVPAPNQIGVVSYVLPISGATREENSKMRDAPSERWSHTRLFGEQFNQKLETHLVTELTRRGYFAVAPDLEKSIYRWLVDERVGNASTWSQRHIAFAAGLGTFGLSDGLITQRGKAHRLGSIVVNQRFESPSRPDDIHRDCLFFRGGECMECAKRCPVGAISEKGHDKRKCAEFVFGQTPIIRERYGIDIYACGLCQCGVPCENRIPG
jgi:epoxyqueuosine reductase